MFEGKGKFNMATILKANDIGEDVRAHLVRVYQVLAFTFITAAMGVYAHLSWNIGGTLTFIGTIICVFAVMMYEDRPENLKQQIGFIGLLGFCKGASIGPLVKMALAMNPSIVLQAFVGSIAIFTCFSLSAMLSQRRAYIYLGGILSSALTLMLWLGLSQLFFRSELIFNIQLYGGLLMFCGYILFDTQMIIEKASMGQRNPVRHALELFIDFVGLFVRVLIILMKNNDKKKNSNRR